jgi:hypothetical protein
MEGPLLRECIERMHSAGQSPELVTGTKLFCHPDIYTSVLQAIQGVESTLRPYHVVVTEDLRPLVMQVVKGFPRALKVKLKEEGVIAKISRSGKWIPVFFEPAPAEAVAAAPEKAAQKDASSAKEPKNAKDGKTSAKAAPCAGAVSVSASPADQPLPLDSLLQSQLHSQMHSQMQSLQFPPLNPALAFPLFNPDFPAPLEVDPAFVNLMHALEQHQKMINAALMLEMNQTC